jgi:hypothetical protein
VPPWHIVQVVFQVAPWHWAQETETVPPTPSSAAPWQASQLAMPELAAYAWNPVLVWSIHAAAWPVVDFVPQGWQASQVNPF